MTRRGLFDLLGAAVLARARAAGQVAGAVRARRLLAGRRLLIVPYTHIDWAWTHTRQWQADRSALALCDVLDILRGTPEYRFFVDTWNEQVEPFLERRPERVAEFRRALASGKVAVCGGTVTNQHPGWMESESLVRNMVLGQKLFRTLVPDLTFDVMVQFDVTPGSSQMPQILRKAGYRGFRTDRPDASLSAEGVPRNFVWTGLDGTELLVSRGHYGGFSSLAALEDFQARWDEAVARFYETEVRGNAEPRGGTLVWLPMGSDDVRPLRSALGRDAGEETPLPLPQFVRAWKTREKTPLGFATPVEYFRELEKERASLPRHKGVLEPTLWTFLFGLNGNRGLRRWRAAADQALVAAECLWSCAAAAGETYPAGAFERLWRDQLRTYSHAQMWLFKDDYARQLGRTKGTLATAEDLRDKAARTLAGRVNVPPERPSVLLFNTLPWERTEVVEVWAHFQQPGVSNFVVADARGDAVPHQVIDVNSAGRARGADGRASIKEALLLVRARVPAMGYTTLYFDPAPGQVGIPAAAAGARLETEFASVELSSRGVVSLLDKDNGARYRAAGNVIYNVVRETGPYHFGPVEKTLEFGDASLERMFAGALKSEFVLSGALGPHRVRLTGSLYPHAKRISFRASIDSEGGCGHFMATVGLPAAGRLACDVHFGVEDRDLSRIAYKGPERLRANVFYGGHWTSWSDGGRGITLVGTTGEKGYQYFPSESALGHFLLMNLPPAPPGSWERFVTSARGGTGRHVFEYDLLLHSGDWRDGDIPRRALAARTPILVVSPDEPRPAAERMWSDEASFASVRRATAAGACAPLLSALYLEPDGYRVRLYESAGRGGEVVVECPFRVAAAQEVDFRGEPLGKPAAIAGREIRCAVRPWEIVTLRITPV